MVEKYIFGRNKFNVTMCDGRDGVLGSGCYPKNTVTIDTLRHAEMKGENNHDIFCHLLGRRGEN